MRQCAVCVGGSCVALLLDLLRTKKPGRGEPRFLPWFDLELVPASSDSRLDNVGREKQCQIYCFFNIL